MFIVLSWYKLSDDKIVIKPYTDPTSSYWSPEDKGVLLDKMEALFEKSTTSTFFQA